MNRLPSSSPSFLETRRSKISQLEDYERLYHSRRYLAEHSRHHLRREDQLRIGTALGYNTSKHNFLQRITEHRAAYDELQKSFPRVYLRQIGADEEELLACLEADTACYETALRLPRYPRQAAVRLIPTVYAPESFPPGTTEREAVAILREKYPGRICFLGYGDLVTVRIVPDEPEPEVIGSPPYFRITRKMVMTGLTRGEIGRTRVR